MHDSMLYSHEEVDVSGLDAVYMRNTQSFSKNYVMRTDGATYRVFLMYPDEHICIREPGLEVNWTSCADVIWNDQNMWTQLAPDSDEYRSLTTTYRWLQETEEGSSCTTTESVESEEDGQCNDTQEYPSDWVEDLIRADAMDEPWTDSKEGIDAMNRDLDEELRAIGVDPTKVRRTIVADDDDGIVCVEEEFDDEVL